MSSGNTIVFQDRGKGGVLQFHHTNAETGEKRTIYSAANSIETIEFAEDENEICDVKIWYVGGENTTIKGMALRKVWDLINAWDRGLAVCGGRK